MRLGNTRVLSRVQRAVSPSATHVQLVCSFGTWVIFLNCQFQIEDPAQRAPRGEITRVGTSSEAPNRALVLPTGQPLLPSLRELTLFAFCASGGVA